MKNTSTTKIILGVVVVALVCLGLYLDSRPIANEKDGMMGMDNGHMVDKGTEASKKPANPANSGQPGTISNPPKTGTATTIVFTVPKANPLAGTDWTWKYTTFANKSKTMTPNQARFVLKFDASGRVTSTTDCNSLAGTYSIKGEQLHFGPFAATLMACTGQTMEQEYAQELNRTTTFKIVSPNEMQLNLSDAGVMVFTRQ